MAKAEIFVVIGILRVKVKFGKIPQKSLCLASMVCCHALHWLKKVSTHLHIEKVPSPNGGEFISSS